MNATIGAFVNPKPFRLVPSFQERVWGVRDLSPWFPDHNPAAKIGEVWFDTPELPLLLKFLFTSENLSVQVHPPDAYAAEQHHCSGKTEAWYVIAAEAGARVALGLTQVLSPEEARQAFTSGTIEEFLDWRPVSKGDAILVPAGTVHAIGAGLRIIEIQQKSDVTYRLFDYGRGRDLHLNHGLAVARLEPFGAPRAGAGNVLAECSYFRLERLGPGTLPPAPNQRLLAFAEGTGRIDGADFAPGDVWAIPPGCEIVIESDNCDAVLCGGPQNGL